MKKLSRGKTICVGIILALVTLSARGGPFYVVIGTFSEETGARKFAHYMRDIFPECSFRFEADRRLYHVYAIETNRRDEAENLRRHLQEVSGFGCAWVFTDLSSGSYVEGGGKPASDNVTLELYTGGSVLLGSGDNSYVSIRRSKGEVPEAARSGSTIAFTFVTETAAGRTTPARILLMNESGATLSDCKNGEVVSFGGKQLRQVLILVCQAPGFNAETKVIDLANPAGTNDVIQNAEGVWEVRFHVTRLDVDEVTLRYHDLFYPDAAVLKPASKKRIDVLLSLLRSNPGSAIVINSHCNPDVKRNVILRGSDTRFFDLSGGAAERSGSDRVLTRERAETLRDYLAAQGVDVRDITAMGWGSVHRLVPEGDAKAGINERIDIALVRK